MKAVIVLPILLISGCNVTFNQIDLERANMFCKDNDGVFSVSRPNNATEFKVICRNGESSRSNLLPPLTP